MNSMSRCTDRRNRLVRALAAFALTILIVAVWHSTAFAAFDAKGWTWRRPILADNTPAGFVRIQLTPEVLDGSQLGLSDLRVVDDEGRLTPFVVQPSALTTHDTMAWKPVQLINRTFQPEQFESVVLDFGQAQQKNRVRVALSDTNYRRRAQLEGSDDAQSWSLVLENAWFFAISRPGEDYRVDTLDFPVNTFRYLRLTVFNMPDDPRRITIQNVDGVFYEKAAEPVLSEVPIRSENRSVDEKAKSSDFALNLGLQNQPIVSVALTIRDPYFYRAYELLGRNRETQTVSRLTESGPSEAEREVPWTPIARGILYRTQTGGQVEEATTVRPIHAPYRYLKLRIYNQDNPPLSVDAVKVLRAAPGSLVFEYAATHSYSLLGGNAQAGPPQFDLAHSVKDVAQLSCPFVTLGPPVELVQTPEAVPWTERNVILLWVALLLAVGVMGVLIFKNLGKIQHP